MTRLQAQRLSTFFGFGLASFSTALLMGATTANAKSILMAAKPTDTAQLLPDFVIKFDNIKRPTNFPDQKGLVKLVVTNQGNGEYKGPLKINLYASTDSVLNRNTNGQLVNDELLGSLDEKNVNLKPGQSKTFNLNFATPNSYLAPGNLNVYSLTKCQISKAFNV